MITWQDNSTISHDEWLLKRLNTIGASEIGTIVHGSKYSSSLEIFYAKIGSPTNNIENIRMWLGKETEETSAKMWSYYDGKNDDSIVKNARANNPLKEYINLNATCFNTDYPYLSCTPDREIQGTLKYAGRGKGTLEIKNTQSYVLAAHEGALPTDNVFQIVTQLMLPCYEYGELFYFIDNRTCQSHEIERKDTKNIEEIIVEKTTVFFENVKKARPLYNQAYEAKRQGNQRLVDKLQIEIAQLEPPPQNTTGYLNFLSQRYQDRLAGAGVIQGKDDHLLIARNHKALAKQIDALETEQRKIEIVLKQTIGDMSALDFGKNGKVSWYVSKNGNRLFKNNVK